MTTHQLALFAVLVLAGLGAHLVADYMLQSDWMATKKLKDIRVAYLHGGVHAALFLPILYAASRNWRESLFFAVVLVGWTHAYIDRYRAARYVCYAKEFLAPRSWRPSAKVLEGYRLSDTKTGYSPRKPEWLAFWLLILVDNTMHILINTFAIWAVMA